jgi:hypothetical protein
VQVQLHLLLVPLLLLLRLWLLQLLLTFAF